MKQCVLAFMLFIHALAPCPTPRIPFSTNSDIIYDPTINLACHKCDPGYALSNSVSGQRTCQSNNSWSGVVTCERILCPALSSPFNGEVSVNTHTIGSLANYTCNDGYTLVGAETTTCVQIGVTGRWTSETPACLGLGKLSAFTCDDDTILYVSHHYRGNHVFFVIVVYSDHSHCSCKLFSPPSR